MGSRILIVEDSAVIRRLIEVCLRAADLEIITRDDGRTGLTAVSSESPDLVVLDIGLPGMDGWEVLDRIRKDPTTKSIPVVVLTAHAEEESRRRASPPSARAGWPVRPKRGDSRLPGPAPQWWDRAPIPV
jgi:CheY-like chemotaxis protein